MKKDLVIKIKNKIKEHWRAIVACIVCAFIFFFIGMALGKTGGRQMGFAGGNGSFPSGTSGRISGVTQRGGGFASGQIITKDAQAITLQLPNGNSEVVFYSSSTQVIKPTAASLSDVVAGTQVMIGGSQNSDGSLTAQSIQIRTTGASSGQ